MTIDWKHPQTQAQRLLVALDVPSAQAALALVDTLSPLGVGFKVGLQLFLAEGWTLMDALNQRQVPVFWDLKLHDIPNTVAGAVDSMVRHGASFLNVHTQGGTPMMQAAAQQAQTTAALQGQLEPLIIGVTVLTSMDATTLATDLNQPLDAQAYALHLAKTAQKAGLGGVVCSAQEAGSIRQACGPDFVLVTPGIRPAGSDVGDQSRIQTPAQALQAGATYLVIGRPITQALDPSQATQAILNEIRQG
jgi:orotidine-5'-phosphate decarboxylase